MDYKRWRGLEVDAGLKDPWLDRLNDISGLTVLETCEGHPGDPRQGLALYPHFSFQVSWDIQDDAIAENLHKIAKVWLRPNHSFRVATRIPRSELSESDYEIWWETIITKLEQMGSFAKASEAGSHQIEDEILEGAATVLAWYAKIPPPDRRKTEMFYGHPITPPVMEKTIEFLRDLESLNGTSLRDLYQHSLERRQAIDISNMRVWFGTGAALKAIGSTNWLFDEFVQGLAIPEIAVLLEGPYYACVFTKKESVPGPGVAAILVANERLGIWSGIQVMKTTQDVVVARALKCSGGTMESALAESQKGIDEAASQMDSFCGEGLEKESLVDFLASHISSNDEEWLRARLRASLLECFASDLT